MKTSRISPITILLILLLSACGKEESLDNGGSPIGPPPVGTNCRLNEIIAADSLTGEGLLSLFTRFNSAGQGTRVTIFDSIANAIVFEGTLQYRGDTIRISPTDFFLTDAQGRVRYYQTVDISGPGTETLSVEYSYDAQGYLKERVLSLSSIPVPAVRFSYTWSGQNLVAVDGSVIVPGFSQKVLTAELEYDAGRTAKNFIPIFPDGFETAPYIMALNLGKPSRNLVKKISTRVYDENGDLAEELQTEFSNYKFSPDGYLLEWFAKGDAVDGALIPEGRSLFKYFCP